MKNVLKTAPAVFITVLLMSNTVLADDFGALPKVGPVPEMRPIHVMQAKLESRPGLTFAGSCGSACVMHIESVD